jgi:hypothetical protein
VKGQAYLKNSSRADNLARAKIDFMKDYTRQVAANGQFSGLSYAPLVIAYTTPQAIIMDNANFTWSLSYTFMAQVTPSATSSYVTYPTKVIQYKVKVSWKDKGSVSYTSSVFQSAIVTDPSQ